jgi:HEAT repeat protein
MTMRVPLVALCVCAAVMVGCSGTKRKGWSDPVRPPAPPPTPAAQNVPIDPSLRGEAKAQILMAAQGSDAILRANAIEAAQLGMGADAKLLINNALKDREAIVRFAASMAAGTLRVEETKPALLEMIEDPSEKVRIGVRFALHRLGDTSRSHDFETLALDPNPRIREDVAFVLGRLEEKSALKILKPLLAKEIDSDVRIALAEACWRLGDEAGLELLVAGMVSRFADDQMLCILALAGPKDRRVERYIRGKLTDPYAEVALVGARALAELGYDDGYGLAMKYVRNNDPRQRFLAASALGVIGRSDAQPALGTLLKDSEPRVRIAAATAILQLKPPM